MKNDRSRQSGSVPRQGSSAALERAFRILARRDHTCKELAEKLRQKGHGHAAIDGALARCRELGYLDDAKTAMTIAGYLDRNGYGPLRIRQTLGQKGLDDTVIEKALTRCGDEDTQVLSAGRVLEKKKIPPGPRGRSVETAPEGLSVFSRPGVFVNRHQSGHWRALTPAVQRRR